MKCKTLFNIIEIIFMSALLCIIAKATFAQEKISEFSNNTVFTVNNEFRKIKDDINSLGNMSQQNSSNVVITGGNITGAINATSFTGPIFGAWVDKSSSYGAQQAATDGMIIARGNRASGAGYCQGFSDANTDPTTMRAVISTAIGDWGTITLPVKKNDYWKIVTTWDTGITVYWIPLES